MGNRSDDLYRLALENDARDAVRNLYQQQLNQQVEQGRISTSDMANRMDRFENGTPFEQDRAALGKAMKAHMDVAYAGGTPLEAAVAANVALNHEREQKRDPRFEATNEKELTANQRLDQHIEQSKEQRPEGRTAEQELEKHMQQKNRELAGTNPYQDMQ